MGRFLGRAAGLWTHEKVVFIILGRFATLQDVDTYVSVSSLLFVGFLNFPG